MRIELKVVLSVTGKTVCKPSSGRKAIGWPSALVVAEGTGAPERKKNRACPTAPGHAGHRGTDPVTCSGLLPVSAGAAAAGREIGILAPPRLP